MPQIRAFGAGFAFLSCLLMSVLRSEAGTDFMTTGTDTTAPIGHHMFCIEQPQECVTDAPAAAPPLALDPALMAEVAAINTRTNAEIEPMSDLALFGVEEHWAYPEGKGDCEDYVLLKRRELHAAGIALSDLLITVVRKKNGEGHAVLTLHTTDGDFVLDNLDWRIKAWRDTPYTYLKRQSGTDPRRWVAITDESEVVVGALGR